MLLHEIILTAHNTLGLITYAQTTSSNCHAVVSSGARYLICVSSQVFMYTLCMRTAIALFVQARLPKHSLLDNARSTKRLCAGFYIFIAYHF